MAQERMPREWWDALVRGEGCPVCVEVASDAQVSEEGYIVADLAVSRLRLSVHHQRPLFLSPEEYAQRAALIRAALVSQGLVASCTGEPLPRSHGEM
jgi:hypothetical protein